MVEVDPVGSDAERFEDVALGGVVLFVDRAPRVSDLCVAAATTSGDAQPRLEVEVEFAVRVHVAVGERRQGPPIRCVECYRLLRVIEHVLDHERVDVHQR